MQGFKFTPNNGKNLKGSSSSSLIMSNFKVPYAISIFIFLFWLYDTERSREFEKQVVVLDIKQLIYSGKFQNQLKNKYLQKFQISWINCSLILIMLFLSKM